jgi:hypothetical protein
VTYSASNTQFFLKYIYLKYLTLIKLNYFLAALIGFISVALCSMNSVEITHLFIKQNVTLAFQCI